MKKILTILGARPQFIKAATVSRKIRERADIEEIIVHTGQHFDQNMSDVFFSEMDIPTPDHFLNINSLSHGAMTGRMLEKIEELIRSEKPDLLMVYGDTNSTLAGSLAASKLHIPVAHVEAGLRSFNMGMPEEVNRILTDRVSKWLFCPTQSAVNNLMEEGFDQFNCEIVLSGDVMYDSVLYYQNKATNQFNIPAHPYALVTLHRQENTDQPDRLRSIFRALNQLAKRMEIILPVHPRTLKKMSELNIQTEINLMEPCGYLEMLQLINNSSLVMTDSGGLQKEAYFLSKPCLTMRDETEWTELVEAKVNFLVGADEDKIIKLAELYFGKEIDKTNAFYGNGNAAKTIVDSL